MHDFAARSEPELTPERTPLAIGGSSAALAKITPKQRAVLKLALFRKTSKEMARELGVSPRAVDQRLDAARLTLGSSGRFDAACKFAGLSGTSERLTSEPFLLGEYPLQQPVDANEPAHYRFGDALQFPADAAWTRSLEADPDALRRFVPGLPSATSGWRDRIAWIVIGAIAILMMVLIGLAVADSLAKLTGGR